MVGIESAMADRAEGMKHARSHGVDRHHVDRAIEEQDAAIRASAGDDSARLSDEQRRAIEHITGPERIAAVVGYAGAGKARCSRRREAWEAQGYTVHGAALSGKAAEGLEESSGIQSRTLASYEYRWQSRGDTNPDRGRLNRGDVFVIDEAGMIGSRQLSRFINEAEQRGAKIVLVGDHEQLQAIGAGAPFRAIAEQIGHAELSEIRRQRVDWQREASVDFATHRTAEGLAAYRDNGNIWLSETRDEARGEIVRDYLADRDERPDGTRVAMAHRRADVRAINDAIRSALQDSHRLGRGEEGGELAFQTNDGKREFAPGDRIVFLENDRDLGVKNGMLGTVESVEPGRLTARLDGAVRSREDARSVSISTNDYRAIDHGYATTIHKNQGATVDRAFVMASGTMDRHLTYVAMTRHRDGAQLYAAQDEFADRNAGRLVEHGTAPYQHDPKNRDSYFVTLENDRGQKHTVWGVDLGRAMAEAKPEIGDRIGLEHRGSETVRLPDGTTAERNAWKVHEGGELAYAQRKPAQPLGREGNDARLHTRFCRAARDCGADGCPQRDRATSGQGADAGANPGRTSGAAAKYRGRKSGRGSTSSFFASQGSRTGSYSGPWGRSPAATAPRHVRRPETRARRGGRRAAARPRRDGPRAAREPRLPGAVCSTASSSMPPQPVRRSRKEGARGEALAPDRQAERLRRPSEMERAIDRYARAYDAAERNHREGLPILETQKQEVRLAGQQLDQARPGASALMVSALQHDPEARAAMQELSGRERVGQLSAGMDRERTALADPNVRAERFVQRWQELQGERQELRGWRHDEARGQVEGQMRGMTKSLERDPQVESILRNRSQDLGIGHVRQSESLARNMEQSLARGRSQNLGMER